VTGDMAIHPRFIKRVAVRFKDQLVEAEPAAYLESGDTVLLQLDEPIDGGEVLSFDANASSPYYAVSHSLVDGCWHTSVEAVGGSVVVREAGQPYIAALPNTLIIDASARAVGWCIGGELPVDGSWKGSPLDRATVASSEIESMLARIGAISDRILPRVTIKFRSPRSDTDGGMGGYYYDYYGGGSDESITEWNGTGVLVGDQVVMVLGKFKAKQTARLERIRVFPASGESVDASFVGSLRDHGCLLARLDEPLGDAAEFAAESILDVRNDLLMQVEVSVHGENRSRYCKHARIASYSLGWERNVYPAAAAAISRGGYYDWGESVTLVFLFTTDGRLLAVPLARRQKVTVQDEWSDSGPILVPVTQLTPILEHPEPHIDPDNRPLSEEEENRLAWLGVELQAMSPDLARVNDISHLTRGGSTGALVTYIYDGSPARAAGIELGDVLLRVHVEGHPKPLDIELMQSPWDFGGQFPWEQLDQVPPEYFDQIPMPWGSADNTLNRSLTELGFGTPCTAEIFRNGETQLVDFVVTQGPPHYEAAKRFKSEPLGITVRDLTYEVRRYFQIPEGDPGVIISKVEPGEKAAIAGLRPFEIVISVDDVPIESPDAFEEAVSERGEHRLFVKRMTEGRTVKLESPAIDAEVEDGDAQATR
jgi:hypothetical protein